MAVPSWGESHPIGVRDLDGQHRVLATLIRDLHDVMKHGRSVETINAFFEEVVEYAKYHFAAQERVMRDSRFPGHLSHKAVHDKVTAQLLHLREQFQQGGRSAINLAVFEFLRAWLFVHMRVEDPKIARHVASSHTAPSVGPASSSVH